MENIHDRMPVILSPDLYADWLNPANHGIGDLKEYLLLCDPALMKAYPVSKHVGNVKNQGPKVVEETRI